MVLSSDEIEILNYVQSWDGAPITVAEVCRSAGGRKRYRETPNWARSLMSRLVDAKLLTVNDRGHYTAKKPIEPEAITAVPIIKKVVEEAKIVEPAMSEFSPAVVATQQEGLKKLGGWMSPHLEEILKKSGKTFAV